MHTIREIRIPKYPDSWESCGLCASGDIFVDSVLVSPGQSARRDHTLILLETGIVALDIPSPCDGTVVEVCMTQYDLVEEGDLIVRIEAS